MLLELFLGLVFLLAILVVASQHQVIWERMSNAPTVLMPLAGLVTLVLILFESAVVTALSLIRLAHTIGAFFLYLTLGALTRNFLDLAARWATIVRDMLEDEWLVYDMFLPDSTGEKVQRFLLGLRGK